MILTRYLQERYWTDWHNLTVPVTFSSNAKGRGTIWLHSFAGSVPSHLSCTTQWAQYSELLHHTEKQDKASTTITTNLQVVTSLTGPPSFESKIIPQQTYFALREINLSRGKSLFYLLPEAPATTAQSKIMACSPMAFEITSSVQKLTKQHQFSSQRHLWARQWKKISFTKQELTISTPLFQPKEELWQNSLQRGGWACVVGGRDRHTQAFTQPHFRLFC